MGTQPGGEQNPLNMAIGGNAMGGGVAQYGLDQGLGQYGTTNPEERVNAAKQQEEKEKEKDFKNEFMKLLMELQL